MHRAQRITHQQRLHGRRDDALRVADLRQADADAPAVGEVARRGGPKKVIDQAAVRERDPGEDAPAQVQDDVASALEVAGHLVELALALHILPPLQHCLVHRRLVGRIRRLHLVVLVGVLLLLAVRAEAGHQPIGKPDDAVHPD